MKTSINYNIMENKKNSFYMFECNSPNINRKFVTFIYGNYSKLLKDYDHTMIFRVESILPHEWNIDIYADLRKQFLSYEVAHKMIEIPVYRVKHKLSLWHDIFNSVTEYNQDYLNN